MIEKREKFYTISARLLFSSIIVVLLLIIALSASSLINRGPILPLFGVVGAAKMPGNAATTTIYTSMPNGATNSTTPIIVEATCAPTSTTFYCEHPYFNYSTGVFTIALSQVSGYNWTLVTVVFVPANTIYSHGVPYVSWTPPGAVNVTGGLLNDTTRYINIPISSGPVAVGTNITGSIWAKYQLTSASMPNYANLSSAVIVVRK